MLIGEHGHPLLCDFGLDSFRDNLDNVAEAPPQRSCWLAPERLNPEGFGLRNAKDAITIAADVYSFGMTAYEVKHALTPGTSELRIRQILTHTRPFAKERAFQVVLVVVKGGRPSIPAAWDHEPSTAQLATLISRCWHQDRTMRPTTTEVSRILVAIEGSLPHARGALDKASHSGFSPPG